MSEGATGEPHELDLVTSSDINLLRRAAELCERVGRNGLAEAFSDLADELEEGVET
jgi:hypothetical protein